MTTADKMLYEEAVETVANSIAYATALAYYSEGADIEETVLDTMARESGIDGQIEIISDMFHTPLLQVQNDIIQKANEIDINDFITAIALKDRNLLC